MTLTVTPSARRALAAWLERDPSRAALRIAFAGGCGALGYRLTLADRPMAGDEVLHVDGLTFFLDFKSRADLDGARIDAGDEGDDAIVIVHDRVVVGTWC